MKQIKRISRWLAPLVLVSTSVAHADLCPTYDEVAGKLEKRYGEQKLFSGFGELDAGAGANAVYEFWSNPQRGNWTLLAHKLLLFQDGGRRVTRSCAFVVDSGKRHRDLAELTAPASPAVADAGAPTASGPNCVARSQHAQVLADKYHERPTVQALSNDKSLLEIYAGEASWTITRARVRELHHPISGAALRDRKTGQEIRSLCSRAVYSGGQWGRFALSSGGAI